MGVLPSSIGEDRCLHTFWGKETQTVGDEERRSFPAKEAAIISRTNSTPRASLSHSLLPQIAEIFFQSFFFERGENGGRERE